MVEPNIYLGPPGTGKTTTLLDIVDQEMVNGVPPDRIGFMTFTKKGVEEAISRASRRFNLPREKFRYFNTLHSAAFRHLGLNSSQVLTGKKVHEFGNAHGWVFHGSVSSDDGTYSNFSVLGDDIVLFFENLARISMVPFEEMLLRYPHLVPDVERALKIVKDLRAYKDEEIMYDFTDMIEEFVKQNDPPRLEVLMVDEAQDLSLLQWKMVDVLSRHVKRLYIAGDDDQTIFTWAGASEKFISMPGNVTVLQQSFRVPGAVHALANRIISGVTNRRSKSWRPRDAEGSYEPMLNLMSLKPERLDPELGTVMMLARTGKLLKQRLIPYCRYHGLLYRNFDHNSIKPSLANAIQAWSELQDGRHLPADQIVPLYDLLPSESHKKKPGVAHGFKSQLRRIADQPDPPKFNMRELQKNWGLTAFGPWDKIFTEIHPSDVEYIKKVMARGFSIVDQPHILISTIHRVKGGQANTVVLLSDQPKAADRLFVENRDEETRVFYTAVTRAFEDLIVIHPDTRRNFERLFT